MIANAMLFSGGVALGIICLLGGLMLSGKINRVTGYWALCWAAGILGVLSSMGGVYIETFYQLALGLWLMVFGATLMGMCGVFATVGAKYQAEEKTGKQRKT